MGFAAWKLHSQCVIWSGGGEIWGGCRLKNVQSVSNFGVVEEGWGSPGNYTVSV